MTVCRATRTAVLMTVLAVAACSGGLSLSEYAGQVENLLYEMNDALEGAERAWRASQPSLDGTRAYHAQRVEARRTFVTALESLEPPDSVAELHAIALDLISRLTEAEVGLAAKAASIQTVDEISSLWDGAEGQAFAEIDAEAIAFCRGAQAHFDASESAEALEGTPFIPPEMREVVIVAFRCTSEERDLDR